MFKNPKITLAIITIPLLGLAGIMAVKPLNVETDTNVERQEFSIVEQKVNVTETKVAEIDTKVQEVKNVQAEQAKQIEEVKTQVQEVKTVVVQAPAPVAAPVKIEAKIDYDKLILDKAMTKEGFGTDKKNSYSFGTKTKRSFFLLKAGENTWYWSTVGSSYVPANKITDVQALAWLDTIN